MAALRHADHVIHLHLAAGAETQRVHWNTGIEMDRRRRVAAVGHRHVVARRKTAPRCRPCRPSAGSASRDHARRAWAGRREALEHELARDLRPARSPCAPSCRPHRLADARRDQHALALDLDHAGAAIAVGAVAPAPNASTDAADGRRRRCAACQIVSAGSASTSTSSRRKRVPAPPRRRSFAVARARVTYVNIRSRANVMRSSTAERLRRVGRTRSRPGSRQRCRASQPLGIVGDRDIGGNPCRTDCDAGTNFSSAAMVGA